MEKEFTPQVVANQKFCRFRPQLFYQQISSWHECEPSLEFRMNMTTGVNEARYMVNDGVNVEDNLERLQESINAATRVASEGDKCHGHALVLQKLLAAATWGDENTVGYLLRSCYVTESMGIKVLAEAISRNYPSIVKLLRVAGVSEWKLDVSSNKNAFHVACENGFEEIASTFLSSVSDHLIGAVYIKNMNGEDGFDILRRHDMNGIAKRLESQVHGIIGNESAVITLEDVRPPTFCTACKWKFVVDLNWPLSRLQDEVIVYNQYQNRDVDMIRYNSCCPMSLYPSRDMALTSQEDRKYDLKTSFRSVGIVNGSTVFASF